MTEIIIDGVIFETQRYGGVSRIYHEILPRICHLDKSIHFDILTTGRLEQSLPQHGCIQHYSLNYWEMLLRPGRFFQMARWHGRSRALSTWLQSNRLDLWHSTYYTLPDCWQGPVVITVYDLIYERYPQQYNTNYGNALRSRMRKAIMRADIVICISETTKKDVEEIYNIESSKIVVAPLAVSSEFETLAKKVSIKIWQRPYLLYIGGRTGYKNFETVLTAYSRWPQRQQIDLYVVGPPWTSEEKQKIQALKVTDKVHLETGVTDQKLIDIYIQAVAFVHPSLYEGFGLPLLEALSCGCPVVASNIPTSIEIVGKKAAYYFDPQDVNQLIDALDMAVKNGRSAAFLSQAHEVVANYSWQKTAKQTLEVYYALA